MNCNCPRSSYGINHTPECDEGLSASKLALAVVEVARLKDRICALETDNADVAKINVDLMKKNRAREAALREIETFGSGSAVRVAREALGSTAETSVCCPACGIVGDDRCCAHGINLRSEVYKGVKDAPTYIDDHKGDG